MEKENTPSLSKTCICITVPEIFLLTMKWVSRQPCLTKKITIRIANYDLSKSSWRCVWSGTREWNGNYLPKLLRKQRNNREENFQSQGEFRWDKRKAKGQFARLYLCEALFKTYGKLQRCQTQKAGNHIWPLDICWNDIVPSRNTNYCKAKWVGQI